MRMSLRCMSRVVPAVSVGTLNQSVVKAEYAVRGPVPTRAAKIESEIKAGSAQYNFKNLIWCNIGNPQALQQKPLSFVRQVLSLLDMPDLAHSPEAAKLYPADVIARAKAMLATFGPTGAYTASAGSLAVRQSVAEFLKKRDGFAANPDHIFLSNGASTAVNIALNCLIGGPRDAILIPIPQYPLYTATIALLGGTPVGYYLDESANWSLPLSELKSSVAEAARLDTLPRALVVINPGNPTGQVLSRATMEDVIRVCHETGMVLLADEVYQENIYSEGKQWHSFKKVMMEMGAPYNTEVQLISFHSTSKGIIGECGRRGGYQEVVNFKPDVVQQMIKLVSIFLCSNVNGQMTTDLMVNPPRPGDASFDSYREEYNTIYSSLKRRAVNLVRELNTIPGITCNEVEGAMYAFPSLKLPEKFIAEAAKTHPGIQPDEVWCMQLLEETGIVVVPGSGFGQKTGTWHFRTTILPQEPQMAEMCVQLRAFQERFNRRYV